MSLFMAIFTSFLFLLAGLVIDGGVAITGRQRAADEAEQAARFAADDVDADVLHAGGAPRVASRACTRADQVIKEYGDALTHQCAVAIGGGAVTVRVTLRTTTKILAIVGLDAFTSTSTATARPVSG